MIPFLLIAGGAYLLYDSIGDKRASFDPLEEGFPTKGFRGYRKGKAHLADGGKLSDAKMEAAKELWEGGKLKVIKKLKWVVYAGFKRNKRLSGYGSEEAMELSKKDWDSLPTEVKKDLAATMPENFARGGKVSRFEIIKDETGYVEQGFYGVFDKQGPELLDIFEFKKEADGYVKELNEKGILGVDASKYNGQIQNYVLAEGGKIDTQSNSALLKDILKNKDYYFGKYEISKHEYDDEWSIRPSLFIVYSKNPDENYIKNKIVALFNNGKSQQWMEANELPHINYQERATKQNLSYGYSRQDSFEILDISELESIREKNKIYNPDGTFDYPKYLKLISFYDLESNKKSDITFTEDEGRKTIQSVSKIDIDGWSFKVGDSVDFWEAGNWNAHCMSPTPNKNDLPALSKNYPKAEFSRFFNEDWQIKDVIIIKRSGKIVSITNPKINADNPANWIVTVQFRYREPYGLPRDKTEEGPISFLMKKSLNPYNYKGK